jgi:hypothetical protein
VLPPTISCSVKDVNCEILGASPSSSHSTVIEPAETGSEAPAAGEVILGAANAHAAKVAAMRVE